jgi:quercetin dioxygenase-like cupin family protein
VIVIDDERQVVEAGNFIAVPPETWHWHGATKDAAMCHLSIKLPGRPNWNVPLRNWSGG